MVPCPDMRFTKITDPDRYYASVIPFMQFPLLKIGRPWKGTSIFEEGIDYFREENEYYFAENIYKYMQEHPNGPYVYSHWSAIPDDVTEYPRWSKYLALYKPMVEEDSIAYIELRETAFVFSAIPEDVYISMFVNHEMYLVVSNLTDQDYELVLKDVWEDRQSKQMAKIFTVKPGKLLFLIKK